MFIVMHCGGIPFNGDTIKTRSLGGSESAAYYLAKELTSAGHSVTLFTNDKIGGIFEGVKYEWAGAQSENTPLGDRFTYYAENTPHDVCIIQRHPRAFERKYASKINLWWLHDLALYRNKEIVLGQMWNIDKVLVVSEYHAEQVSKVYGIPKESIKAIRNGVDLDMYDRAEPAREAMHQHKYNLFYSSRPERGLLELVKPNGIMDKLREAPMHLHVCHYDNTTPQMQDQYEMLWNRCDEMSNVTLHGALTKTELASLQKACDAWLYPTTFEEVSCITAMEAMAAGCWVLTSAVGALPETCGIAAGAVLPLNEDGTVNTDEFVARVKTLSDAPRTYQRTVANDYTWEKVADRLLDVVRDTFSATKTSSIAHHFMRHSDIVALEKVFSSGSCVDSLCKKLSEEYDRAYAFYREDTYEEHYKAFYKYEADRGVNYGPEDVTGTSRFMAVAGYVASLRSGAAVLDYGCAHGHYTIPLAKAFPSLNFIGRDLSDSNVEKARAWAAAEGLRNVRFEKVDGRVVNDHGGFDLIIAAEVVEHVGNPQAFIDALAGKLVPEGIIVITVPYGPWESQGYRQHGYWRAHLHHFERRDLVEMLGHHPEYKIVAAPSGQSMFSSALGSYILSFKKPAHRSMEIDYRRKVAETMPDQTLACCMIVKDAEQDIKRCLSSVLPYVQEVVIGVDGSTTDNTALILQQIENENPLVSFRVFTIQSPVVQGFSSARNETIACTSCDWILWIDADEVLTNGHTIQRYLRNSMYNGLAIRQHHFSHDPVAVIKIDMPCRIFRNGIGVKFFGAVHEHPEIVLNEGLGPVSILPNTAIVHHGYVDDTVRRKRFNRNLPLLKRDRAELPERLLGKFLWLRDLAQSCQYDIEAGSVNVSIFDERIAEGIMLWQELLEAKNYRLAVDALPYYSQLVQLRGDGVDYSFKVDGSVLRESDASTQPMVHGHFASVDHALSLVVGISREKIGSLDRRYL